MSDTTEIPSGGKADRPRRSLTDKIRCLVGLHEYGEPEVMKTALVISGERTADGVETEVDESPEPDRYVTQFCTRPGCWSERKRPELDPDEVESPHTESPRETYNE